MTALNTHFFLAENPLIVFSSLSILEASINDFPATDIVFEIDINLYSRYKFLIINFLY